ncbi:MAG: hypothetical protein ACK4N5_11765 [Myxococcales bacterium]
MFRPRPRLSRSPLVFAVLALAGCAARPTAAPAAAADASDSAHEVAAAFLDAVHQGALARAGALFDFESQVKLDQAGATASAIAAHQFDYARDGVRRDVEAALSPGQREAERARRLHNLASVLKQGHCTPGGAAPVRISPRWERPTEPQALAAVEAFWDVAWLEQLAALEFVPLTCAEPVALYPDAEYSPVDRLVALVLVRTRSAPRPRVLDVMPRESPTSVMLLLQELDLTEADWRRIEALRDETAATDANPR